MSDPVTLSFTLNGDPVQVTAPGAAPLLFVLRNDLGLQGTRLGCGTGDCGACTVTLDGQPVSACTLA
ncbi:MAG: 2Fe-2S iron-sulfur cluster-binding protein, partial [Paracoccaceae bacterium]|nr:2Fe-2S iron-sulfur cluster-binding protein [Paracoccaceae bacterium]